MIAEAFWASRCTPFYFNFHFAGWKLQSHQTFFKIIYIYIIYII
jgi:hypothetical protein